MAFSSTGCLMNCFRGKAKGRIVGEPLAATQAAPPQDPRQRHLDIPLDDQPELPPPAVMQPEEFWLGRSTTRTRLGVTHPFPCLYPPGVGLDFLLEIHDRESTSLGWGACRDRQVRTPPALSPQECCEVTAARTGGRGPILAFLGGVFRAGGCPGGVVASQPFQD
jgi:hypothetical protein